MANGYVSQVQLPNNETYNIKDKELIPRLKATVGHTCKNLLDITSQTHNSQVVIESIDDKTGSIHISTTGGAIHVGAAWDFSFENGHSYVVSFINLLENAHASVTIRRSDTYTVKYSSGALSTLGNKTFTFTFTDEEFPKGAYVSLRCTDGTGVAGAASISQLMLREASISDDTFEPYQEPTDSLIETKARAYLTSTVGHTCKNYISYDTSTYTYTANGLTFTLDLSAGTVTANGTATANTEFRIPFNHIVTVYGNVVYTKKPIKSGKYYFCGSPSGGTSTSYCCFVYDNTTGSGAKKWDGTSGVSRDYGDVHKNEVLIDDTHSQRFTILIVNGYTASNVVFRPMIWSGDIDDDTFEPYEIPTDERFKDYLPLSGGTLTGHLFMSGKRLYLKGTNIDSDGEDPSSNTWSNSELDFVDKDNTRVSFFNVLKRTNGSTKLELAALNNNYYNVIDLIIDKDGDCSYYVSDPAAFRTAIGAGTSSTDKNVAQANSTSGKYRPIMLGYDEYDSTTSYSTDEITNKVFKSSNLGFKPDSGTLGIYGSCVGNTASELISGKAGVLSYGDKGPLIEFNTAIYDSLAGAIIYTNNDSVATGVSWSFVSNLADWNVISKRFHARTGISIGTELPQTSYTLYINGNTYATDSIFLAKTKGYYLTNSANNTYAAINDNGDNLWVGASSAQKEHHRGTNGQTYISSGWSTKNNSGNDTIFVSVPTLTTSGNTETWTHTAHAVLHNGNTSFTLTLSSGTKIGTIKINGTSTDLYCLTNTNTHRPILVNGTEVLGNNTTALNLKAGNNISLSHSSGTVTITGTDTNTTYTLSTGDSNGQIKVTPSNGNAYNVSVKGLGSNAYTSTAFLPLTGGTLSGNLTIEKGDGGPLFHAKFSYVDYTKDNNGIDTKPDNYWIGYKVLDKNSNRLSLFYSNIVNNGVILTLMRTNNYNSSDTDNPYSAFFGVQVTKSGTVDYLFSHRLRFARNLTNESITTPQYVVSLTNSWENFGYTTIANLKTTLGIPSNPVYTDTKNTAGSTDTSDKIFLIGAKSLAANPLTYSDSQVYVTSGSLFLTKTLDASGTADNKPALLIGNPTGSHLEFDGNEVMAKDSVTTTGPLFLNTDGGLVYANNKKVVRLTSDPTSGLVMIADGTNGQIKSSGWTIAANVPKNAVFTDTKVSQTATTTSANYEILFSASASNEDKTEGAGKTSGLIYNPNIDRLWIGRPGTSSGSIALYGSTNGASSYGVLKLSYNVDGSNVTHTFPSVGGYVFNSGNVSAGAGIIINSSGDRYTIESKNKIYLHKTYTSLFNDINDDDFRNCKYFKIYYEDSNNCNYNCITINMNENIFPLNSSSTSYVNGKTFTLSCVGDVNKTYLRTATFHFATISGRGTWKLVFNSSFLWEPSAATGSSITWTSTKQTKYSNSYIKIIKLEYFFEDH